MANRWPTLVRTAGRDERGAALVMVLLFMVVALILITSVLAVTGNEIQIAGLHRDTVRALELAHAGLQEAVVRIQNGHDFSGGAGTQECPEGFTPSVPPAAAAGEDLKVGRCERSAGLGSVVYEVQADATVGRAVRRLSLIVKTIVLDIPPNIVLSKNVTKDGSADITGGDVYSETYVDYQKPPTTPDQRTFAGWRIREQKPPTNPTCYARPCAVDPKWYPGQRRMVRMDSNGDGVVNASDLSQQILTNAPQNPLVCTPNNLALLPVDAVRAEDPNQDPIQDAIANPLERRLYGFDADLSSNATSPTNGLRNARTTIRPCGLPYTYVQETMLDKDGNPLPGPVVRWFKTVIFEQWFETYYTSETDASGLTNLVPRKGDACTDVDVCLTDNNALEPDFENNPEFAAIPPYPSQAFINSLITNANQTRTGGGVITGGSGIDFGCPPADAPSPHTPQPPGCPAKGDTRIVALVGGNYTINSNINGNGVIVVTGNLNINGTFKYYGTLFVDGTVTLGSGNVTITGGLVTKQTTILTGNITVRPGQNVGTAATSNQPTVIVLSMWER